MSTVVSILAVFWGGLCSAMSLTVAVALGLRVRAVGRERDANQKRLDVERESLVGVAADAKVEADRLRHELRAERETLARLQDEARDGKQREATLLEAQEAFLARMSHELRTPLNAVTGYAELLLEEADPAIAPDLERIRIAALNLTAQVTAVLDLSELQSGDWTVKPEVLALEPLVRRVCDATRFVAQTNRNAVEVSVETGLAGVLDARMVSSILFHLVGNACKFTTGGTVRVGVRSAQPNLRGVPTDAIEIVISDTGIGMTERQIEAAFKPFSQGDTSFTRRYDGSGIGLAVVHGFVDAMGGDLAVTSTAGNGATIKVLLPKEVRARSADREDEDTMLLR